MICKIIYVKEKLPVFKCSSLRSGLCVNMHFFLLAMAFLDFGDGCAINTLMGIESAAAWKDEFWAINILLRHQYNFSLIWVLWNLCSNDLQKARQKEDWYRNTKVATGLSKWEVKMHWKLNCWAREKWQVFFVRNHSWDESHLIFVVMTSAQKHAAKMWCWHKAVRYYC